MRGLNFIKKLFQRKCQYSEFCEYYKKESPSCNNDFFSGYCGKEREYNKNGIKVTYKRG